MVKKVSEILWQVESKKLSQCLPKLHGHYLLQYSAVGERVLKDTTLNHDFFGAQIGGEQAQVQMDFQLLPFRDNSLDCVLAHHVLDYDPSPHQCLREAARVVVPNGYLVLIGFNAWSFLGLSRISPRSLLPQKGRYLSRRRLMDWLALLGFRVEQTEYCHYMPPFLLKRFPNFCTKVDALFSYLNLPFAGSYILVARKLVAGRTPIRPQWRALAGQAVSVNKTAVNKTARRG